MGNRVLHREAFANGAKNEKDPILQALKDEYRSPSTLVAGAKSYLGIKKFDLDAAASKKNTLAPRFYTVKQDALTLPWEGGVWCNPPYSRTLEFLRHAWNQIVCGNAKTVTLLVNAITETKAWFEYAKPDVDGGGAFRRVWLGAHEGISHVTEFGKKATSAPREVECIELYRRLSFTNPELCAYKTELWEAGKLPKQKGPRDGKKPVDGESSPKGSALIIYTARG